MPQNKSKNNKSKKSKAQYNKPPQQRIVQEEDYDEELEDEEEEDQENPFDYCVGGYHPVQIGDVFNKHYYVIRKLGWGYFSTVWLCWNTKDKKFVALKIVKSATSYTETAIDEIKLLKDVRHSDPEDSKRNRVVQLTDDFLITGIHGTHVCMVFEVLGVNLLKLIIDSRYEGIPLANVKSIIKQTLEGLDYLHRKCKIIHTDIKPENILLTVDDDHIRHLAFEAAEYQQNGMKMPKTFLSTYKPPTASSTKDKISRNKKRKLKKKAKRKKELLEQQVKDFSSVVDQESLSGLKDCNLDDADACSASLDEQELDEFKLESISEQELVSSKTVEKTSSVENDDGNQKMELDCSRPNESDNSSNTSNEPPKQKRHLTNHNNNNEDHHQMTNQLTNQLNEQLTNKAVVANHNNNCNSTITTTNNSNNNNNNNDYLNLPSTTQGNEPTTLTSSHDSNLMNNFSIIFEEIRQQPIITNSTNLHKPNPATEVCKVNVKIADLGNGCWVDRHFTDDIQTRQYRCLEVLLGSDYGPPCDIWSTACMAFELATGDFLFDPKQTVQYCRDEDHLAHIIELLGNIPTYLIERGRNSKRFFTKKGDLRHIEELKFWSLYDVLVEKYRWTCEDAKEFSDFLLPMLDYDPAKRATAAECLKSPYLANV